MACVTVTVASSVTVTVTVTVTGTVTVTVDLFSTSPLEYTTSKFPVQTMPMALVVSSVAHAVFQSSLPCVTVTVTVTVTDYEKF